MIAKIWSWCAAERAASGSVVLALLLLAPTAARGVIVEQKHLTHTVRADGSVLESTHLVVRIESSEDLSRWSAYPIVLDEHRRLVRVSGEARHPNGKRNKIRRKDRERWNASGGFVLHTSREVEVVQFPLLQAGSVLTLDFEVEEDPYFPAGQIFLAEDDAVADLRVEILGAGSQGSPGNPGNGRWRWHLAGGASDVELGEGPRGGLLVTARDLPAAKDFASEPEGAPILHYGWGEPDSWADVGRWYEEILRPVPRGEEAVRDLGRELIRDLEEPRERLEAILAFLRQDVRYVAVEVGIGGFRPTAAAETLERRWGDCKDKSLLLIDLLREAGIPSHPALVLASREKHIASEFPSPFQFNHLIVAVPTDSIAVEGSDPVNEGLLFLDPTQTRGSARWLNSAVQEQEALVVRGAESSLVRIPSRAAQESRTLVVEVTAETDGSLSGKADLVLTGGRASHLRSLLGSPKAEEAFRRTFDAYLPGATLGELHWGFKEESLPSVRLSTTVRLEHLLRGAPERPSLQLSGPDAAPAPSVLREDEGTLAVEPVSAVVLWKLTLPESWCIPDVDGIEIANDVGSFSQTLSRPEKLDDGRQLLVVDRRTDVHTKRVEGEARKQLEEVALAESRTMRRRIRLSCSP